MTNYEKENVMDPEDPNLDEGNSSVVSLVDEDEEKPKSQKSALEEKIPFEKTQSLLGNNELKRERRKKKYMKEEHYLKKVWLSRTNSPCPSHQSSLNLSIDSISLKKPMNTQNNLIFKSPFKKPDLKFNFSSLRNSVKSDISSQNSCNESFSSINLMKINKDMTTNEIIKIKKESGVTASEMPGLRKRVCRKVYSILNKEFQNLRH